MDDAMTAVAQRGTLKTARIPIKVVAAPALPKPDWIRVRVSHSETFRGVKQVLREQGLNTVCEEAACPNIGECFSQGTATFMVLGALCTRRCPFCDVAHGRPLAPDVMNHNLETVPRLYREARPGADYAHSLELLRAFKQRRPEVLTKSGLMLGLGETDDEVLAVMRDLRAHSVDMLTVGQYLQPRPGNLPVRRYVAPPAFDTLAGQARQMGFTHAVCGPLVRSSYHADQQAEAAGAQRPPMITYN